MSNRGSSRSGGEHVYRVLRDAGVDLLVGLPGTQTLPLDRVVAASEDIRYVMARHETAIPHIAWGYYEASGRVAATVTVPGPGETNAMHGLKNALEDCVPILHVTGDAAPSEYGQGPIHEIDPHTYDPVVKANVIVRDATDLPALLSRGVETALTPPYGPVRLGVPKAILESGVDAPATSVEPERIRRDNDDRYDRVAELVNTASRPILYVGGGTRRSPGGRRAIRDLADRLDACVITTYKGKGCFPEDDPRFLGVSGGSLPPGAVEALRCSDLVIGFGTDLDGPATQGWTLPMGERFVHVTLDPDDMHAGYDATIRIVADVAEAATAIGARIDDDANIERWDPASVGSAVREEFDDRLDELGIVDDAEAFYTPAVVRTAREVLPDDSIVTVDVGGFRLWAMQLFEAYEPEAFIAAGSWAGMGVGLPAAIEAKLARPERSVVTMTGDGGLLMCIHELATAAAEDLDIIAIVSNNEDYGIISKELREHEGVDEHAFTWESPSFPTIADGFGWASASCDTIEGLRGALREALDRGGPTLIDVDVPTDEPYASQAADFETSVTF